MIKLNLQILLAFVISILIPNALFSSNVSLLFEKANQEYQANKFKEAITLYDSIENLGYISSSIHYNRANAYYKLSNYPRAILYFEKAKVIDGKKQDISSNLEIANIQLIDKIEPLPEMIFFKIWFKLLDTFNSKTWAIISIVSVWILIGFLILYFLSSRFKILLLTGLFAFLILTAGTSFIGFKKYKFETSHKFAILFKPTEYLKSAPDESSTDLFIIHEGLKIEILEQFNDWYKVKLVDGKIGWITENSFERI